jgi:CRISPR type III-B/RAMP module RAMP protein Cmr1
MIRQSYQFDVITPCFCAGADHDKAEVRAASIRGQLRWWFRVLGGFKSLSGITVREQESRIFGATAGDDGRAGQLAVRIVASRLKSAVRDGQELGYANFSDPAYLTFPIQTREKQGQKVGYSGRGVLLDGSFSLDLVWRGAKASWPDIDSLVTVFGQLGALGFRSRRAMGAIACRSAPAQASLRAAMERFSKPAGVCVHSLGQCGREQVISNLAAWLRQWRAHGRSGKNTSEQSYPGFNYAKVDHDHGAAALQRGTSHQPAFRASLGLPIIQFFSSSQQTVNWEWEFNERSGRMDRSYKGEGRFASPVILRPHRDADGKWRALVIFVESQKWPSGKQVYLNGTPRKVSLDLYEAMKADPSLTPFP